MGTNSFLNINTVAGGGNASSSTLGTGVVILTGQTAGSVISYGYTVTDAGLWVGNRERIEDVIRLNSTLLPASNLLPGTDYRIDNNPRKHSTPGSSTLTVSGNETGKSISVDTATANGVLTLNSGIVLSNDTWNFGGTGSNTYQITGIHQRCWY